MTRIALIFVLLAGLARAAAAELPLSGPWLQPALPAGTLAYARVPHPVALTSLPKGNALDAALRSPAHLAELARIERGLIDAVFGEKGFDQPFLRGVLLHTRSPVELAVLGAPRPLALIAVTTDLENEQTLVDWLERFADAGTPLALGAPLDADGQAPLVGLPAPAWLRFDAVSGRLLVAVGQVMNGEIMAGIDARLTGDNARLDAMAGRLDDSGFGLLAWLNAEDALPMAQLMLPPEQYAKLSGAGLDDTRAVAFGMGVAGGSARIGVVADLGDRGDSPLPAIENDLGATAVGAPGALLFAALPDGAQLDAIVSHFQQQGEPAETDWSTMKAEMRDTYGFDTDDVLDAIGPDVALIFDDVGDYVAVRLRDRRAFNALLDAVDELDRVTINRVRRGRVLLHHVTVDDALDAESDMGSESDLPLPFVYLAQRARDHYYFTVDGDYAYVSDVPQPLIDRAVAGGKVALGQWLSESQRVAFDHTVFGMTGNSAKLPRRLYYGYLGVMQILADVAGVDFDVLSLPTARELDLPAESPIALSVSLGEPYVSFEITSESSLVDSLLGGGAMQNVAIIGIVAAIAVPAYNDYTIRAQVAEGVALAQAPRVFIESAWAETGQFPGAAEALTAPRTSGKYASEIVVFGDTGLIRVHFDGEDANETIRGTYLYFEPYVDDDGNLAWQCSSWLADKYLPEACRGIEPPDIAGETNTRRRAPGGAAGAG